MKKIIYFILLGISSPFNLNNLSQVSRRGILEYFSKISFISHSFKNIDNYSEKIKDQYILNGNIQEKEDMLINVLNNDIYFYSPITKKSCFELEKHLISLDQTSNILKNKYGVDNGPINLHIQSNGGDLFQSLYIIDLILKLDTPVYTYIDGFAASAATLISVVGKKRFMTENSLMLIHQLSSGVNGKYYEIQDENENLDTLMNFIINIYRNNTKMDSLELNNILKRDIWLNSSYCFEKGFVDEIL